MEGRLFTNKKKVTQPEETLDISFVFVTQEKKVIFFMTQPEETLNISYVFMTQQEETLDISYVFVTQP